jgi:hypothetical protein
MQYARENKKNGNSGKCGRTEEGGNLEKKVKEDKIFWGAHMEKNKR